MAWDSSCLAAPDWYSSHASLLVVDDGSSWISSRLYPGILPGRRMAWSSVYCRMNFITSFMSDRLVALWGVTWVRRRWRSPFSSQLDLISVNFHRLMTWTKQKVFKQMRWPPYWNLENVRTLSLALSVFSLCSVSAPITARSSSSLAHGIHPDSPGTVVPRRVCGREFPLDQGCSCSHMLQTVPPFCLHSPVPFVSLYQRHSKFYPPSSNLSL